MKIRRIDVCDAQLFWELQKQLDGETKFMMLEPDERRYDPMKVVAQISRLDFLLGAEDEGRLIGFVSAKRGKSRRIDGTAYVVVGIIEAYQHQGLGGQFFERLTEWAVDKKIHRLELTVMIHNHPAIALYQKHGFSIEGVRRQAMCVDGVFVDEFYMSKIFD